MEDNIIIEEIQFTEELYQKNLEENEFAEDDAHGIGEDADDIEHKKNWTDDMPSEIESFEPVVDVNDDDPWGSYEAIMSDGKDIIPKSEPILKPEPLDTAEEV